jgi:hypothetical protein
MFIRKARAAAAMAAVAGAAVLVAVGTAAASVNTNAVQTVSNGSAGYSVTNGVQMRNAGVQIVTTPAALNIGHPSGTSNTGGAGEQLCDPNNGFGAQIGEISTGKAFDVEFAYGTLTGAAADNCVGDGLLTGATHFGTSTLTGLAVGDQVDVFASFKNVKAEVRHPGHWTSCVRHGKTIKKCHWHRAFFTKEWQGRLKFQAQDETAGFEVYASPWIHTAADWNLTEAGFGVQQDTNGLSADTPVTCPDGTTSVPGGGPPGPITPAPTGNACAPVSGAARYNGLTGPDGTGAHSALVSFNTAFVNGVGLALPPFTFSSPPILAYGIHEVTTTGNGLNANPATTAPNSSFHTSSPWTFGFEDFVGNVIS